jgi:hypothetical protein
MAKYQVEEYDEDGDLILTWVDDGIKTEEIIESPKVLAKTQVNKPKDDPWLNVLGKLYHYIKTQPNARMTKAQAQGYEFIWKSLKCGNGSPFVSNKEYTHLTGLSMSNKLMAKKRDLLIRILGEI